MTLWQRMKGIRALRFVLGVPVLFAGMLTPALLAETQEYVISPGSAQADAIVLSIADDAGTGLGKAIDVDWLGNARLFVVPSASHAANHVDVEATRDDGATWIVLGSAVGTSGVLQVSVAGPLDKIRANVHALGPGITVDIVGVATVRASSVASSRQEVEQRAPAIDADLSRLTSIRFLFGQLEQIATSYYITVRTEEAFQVIGEAYAAALERFAESVEDGRPCTGECEFGFCCVANMCQPCPGSGLDDRVRELLGRIGWSGPRPPRDPGR